MLMLLLINQESDWPRIIRDNTETDQVFSLVTPSEHPPLIGSWWPNANVPNSDSWENEVGQTEICRKYFCEGCEDQLLWPLCFICSYLPQHKTDTNCYMLATLWSGLGDTGERIAPDWVQWSDSGRLGPSLTTIISIIRTWFQSQALKLFLLCG